MIYGLCMWGGTFALSKTGLAYCVIPYGEWFPQRNVNAIERAQFKAVVSRWDGSELRFGAWGEFALEQFAGGAYADFVKEFNRLGTFVIGPWSAAVKDRNLHAYLSGKYAYRRNLAREKRGSGPYPLSV